jgi:hypothetical protein
LIVTHEVTNTGARKSAAGKKPTAVSPRPRDRAVAEAVLHSNGRRGGTIAAPISARTNTLALPSRLSENYGQRRTTDMTGLLFSSANDNGGNQETFGNSTGM